MSTEVTTLNTGENETNNGAVRGLATVAMLKVNFDAGRDHLDMFEPFVLDAVASLPRTDSATEDVQKSISTRHGLELPLDSLRVVLGRLVEAGYLERVAGRYVRTDKENSTPDVLEGRRQAEERQDVLAKGLLDVANESGIKTKSMVEAKGWILRFLEEHHVALTSDPSRCFDHANPDDRRSALTATYLLGVAQGGGEKAKILNEMLEGFVLQNALLLNEFPDGVSTFKDLEVFADTRVVLSALGLEGPARETATTELIRLLGETGATLSVFQGTIDEVRSILTTLEGKFAPGADKAKLRPSDLTRHLGNIRAKSSDIHMMASMLETDLRRLGFNIRDFPEHNQDWTMSEGQLGKKLAGSGSETDPRVVHDVACIGGVITYRRGKTSKSFDDAKAAFLTTSGFVVKTATEWYRKDGGKGRPPVVHQVELSNLAWLKKPGSAANLKLHELVALCTSALTPDPETWRLFVEHLRELERSGAISSAEAAAIVANSFTQQVLVERGVNQDSDAADLSEAIERVRDEFRGQGAAERERLDRIEGRQRRIAQVLGEAIGWTIAGGIGSVALVGAIVSLLQVVGVDSIPWALSVPPAVLLILLSIFGVIWGFHLLDLQRGIAKNVAERTKRWLSGEGDSRPDPEGAS